MCAKTLPGGDMRFVDNRHPIMAISPTAARSQQQRQGGYELIEVLPS